MIIPFENTQIAFRAKSKLELKRAYWLFLLMSHPVLVRFGTGLINSLLKMRFPIEWLIKLTVFRQFCGGENVIECAKTISTLAQYKIGTILDYSVEGANVPRTWDTTTKEIISTIKLSARSPHIPFCVFKMTGIGRLELLEKIQSRLSLTAEETAEWKKIQDRFTRICEAAFSLGVRVFVDAEESWIQDPVDEICLEAMRKYNREKPIVFTTLQMYLSGRLDFLRTKIQESQQEGFHLGLKIVRGAYMEKERARAMAFGLPSPILPDKLATDAAYNEALKISIESIASLALCAGTHNEFSTQNLCNLMEGKKLPRNDPRVWFAQLLGMSDHLSYNLAALGYNVAKYVPYGPVHSLVPYLSRRAQENTSIAGQTSRELQLVRREISRRRHGHG